MRNTIKNYIYGSCVLLSATGCSILTGDSADGERRITSDEAVYIAKQYLMERNLFWGAPKEIRYVKDKYICTFVTPSKETPLLGERTLFVDVLTGEITIPPRM